VDPAYPTSYDRGAYQRIQAVLLGVAVAGFAFLTLLGFVAVTVTINSIRAAIHSRRDEVTIMQLVGAPRWMVRGPFVVEGAITGALSGAVAGLIVFGLTMAAISAGDVPVATSCLMNPIAAAAFSTEPGSSVPSGRPLSSSRACAEMPTARKKARRVAMRRIASSFGARLAPITT